MVILESKDTNDNSGVLPALEYSQSDSILESNILNSGENNHVMVMNQDGEQETIENV